jgi:hypothetical protein
VGTEVGRCSWEAVYTSDSYRSKPSSVASTLWRLTLVSSDDWEADSAAVMNGSLEAVANMAPYPISSSLILVIHDNMIIGTNPIVLACLCRHF